MKNTLIIAGPSGSGETTLTKMIIDKYPNFRESISATSRGPRENEKEGESYYFLSRDEFEKNIKNGNIIEYTHIKSRDVFYGTYKPDLEKKLSDGFNIIANVDIIGTKYFKEKYGAISIFLIPGSIEELAGRINRRNPGMTKKELEKRLSDAKKEIEEQKYYYDYVVINKDGELDEAFKQIESILIKEGYKLNA